MLTKAGRRDGRRPLRVSSLMAPAAALRANAPPLPAPRPGLRQVLSRAGGGPAGCSPFPRNLPAPPPAGRATAARPPAAAPTLFSSVFPPPGVPFAVRFPGLRPVSPSAFAPGTPCSREPPPTPQAGRGAPLPAPKLVSLPWTLGCVARGRSQTPNERCPRPACLDHRALHPLGLLGCKQRKPALANPRGSEGRVGRGCGVTVSKAEMHVENKEVSSRCSVLLRQEPPSQSLLSLFCLTSHPSDQAAC